MADEGPPPRTRGRPRLVKDNLHGTEPPLNNPPELARDGHGKIRSTEAARALASLRRPKLVPIKYTFLDRFVPHNARRLEWQQQRLEELTRLFGEVSVGVAALIGAAGWHHAAAEFAHEQGLRNDDIEQFGLATRFSNAARANVLSAFDLCKSEAEVRRRNDPNAGNSMGELLTQIAPLAEEPEDEEPPPDPDPPEEAS